MEERERRKKAGTEFLFNAGSVKFRSDFDNPIATSLCEIDGIGS